ncbi:ABC transporter ATP-binding protein [Albidovulum sp.]|jgi:branched-chain amino acid transport system ATP-binding protein|uniref:ABC transporter ATP-binding protein n=1 Tax=Albidovulum sp. TaxID=1872424 RepID=UPI0039B970A8
MLEFSAISTSYGTVPMLRDVSLTVAKGELVCLLGPNGAGKSTTFNTICGLVAPDRGRVRIMGQDVAATGTERLGALGVGFVPEGRRLFPSLTVRQNLRLGYDASRCTEPFEERLAAVGRLFPRIGERLGQGAGTLSGGEQAMVALARALIGDPAFIVMDEPSLGLSPKLIDEYFATVAAIHRQGTTVLLIEQNAETALSLADRGYLLIRGRIAASGTSAELLRDDTVRKLYL